MTQNHDEQYKEQLAECNEEMLFCDGFEEALIGVCEQFGRPPVATYDYDKCMGVLMEKDGMSWEEAIEFFEFNVSGAYMGESTPVFVKLIEYEYNVKQ